MNTTTTKIQALRSFARSHVAARDNHPVGSVAWLAEHNAATALYHEASNLEMAAKRERAALRLPHLSKPFGGVGWTVSEFASIDERNAFMSRYPNAAMPCWQTIAR